MKFVYNSIMEHPEFSEEEHVYSIDFLVVMEKKIKEGGYPTNEEEHCLREKLKSGVLSLDEEQRVITLLNPSQTPVVSLNDDQKEEYEICSYGTNYRIHIPRGGWYDQSTIVFDRKTGLYYIKKPRAVEPL